MSRTDKDRPYRLVEFFEGVEEHDHRFGECRMETFEQATRSRFAFGRSHWRVCKKIEIVPYVCPGRLECSRAAYRYMTFATGDEWRGSVMRQQAFSTRPENYHCITPHQHRVRHDEWACACDEFLPIATCDRRLVNRRAWWNRGVPSDFVNQFHRANRRRVDAELDDVRRAYNAGEDIEPDVSDKFHPSCAAWYYW